MPALCLDYQCVVRPRPWLGLLLLGLALAALAYLVGYYRDLDRRLATWEVRVAAMAPTPDRHRPTGPIAAAEAKAKRVEVEQANTVLRRLALPWEAMFRAVEASGNGRVALLSLEPDPAKGEVRISGEAKDLAAMLAYVKQLGSRQEFQRVLLQSHRVDAEAKERPVVFFLLAKWKVNTP